MLERVAHDNGLVTYQSPLLRGAGVVHAFTTRVGGISEGDYASLNLGSLAKGSESDANTHVAENFRRLRKAIGAHQLMRAEVRQVHGAAVWQPGAKPVRPADAACADAVVSDDPRYLLTVRVADCVPVLLASADGRAVAAVHAGWRGLAAGVIEAAVRALRRRPGVDPERVIAAVGPCIGKGRFEVGEEVAQQWIDHRWGRWLDLGGERPHVDLAGTAAGILQTVSVTRIDVAGVCTYEREDEFFSHRRDVTHRGRAATGRMAAVIAATGEPPRHQEHGGGKRGESRG